MLNRKVVELTDGLIQTQFAERRRALQQELRVAAEQYNARGMFNSGAHLQRVVEICHREIETRGLIVHTAHIRVLSQLDIAPYPELSEDLKGRLAYFLSLNDDYAQYPREFVKQLGLQSHPDIRVHEAREHVLHKIGSEIDLFVETLNSRKQQRPDGGNGSELAKLGTVAPPQAAVKLRSALQKIMHVETRTFVEEAVLCFEYKLYRAAVVLSWVGAISVLYQHVVSKNLAEFNTAALTRFPKWKAAKTADDLALMQEADFLLILQDITVVGKSVRQELESRLKLRNGCGHPNSLIIGEHTVSAHIEVLVDNVFSKFTQL